MDTHSKSPQRWRQRSACSTRACTTSSISQPTGQLRWPSTPYPSQPSLHRSSIVWMECTTTPCPSLPSRAPITPPSPPRPPRPTLCTACRSRRRTLSVQPAVPAVTSVCCRPHRWPPHTTTMSAATRRCRSGLSVQWWAASRSTASTTRCTTRRSRRPTSHTSSRRRASLTRSSPEPTATTTQPTCRATSPHSGTVPPTRPVWTFKLCSKPTPPAPTTSMP